MAAPGMSTRRWTVARRRDRVDVVYVHPDGGPEHITVKAAKVTIKTWPVPGSLACHARIRRYNRRGRHVGTHVFAAVVSIRRELRPP